VNVRYDTAKNWHIYSNISGHTGPIFATFSPYESALRAYDESVPHFPIFLGCCHGNQMLWKCYQRRVIPHAFVALVLQHELQYHGLAVCDNSGDETTSSKNLVNFCLLTPEMAGLICLRVVWHGQKLAYIVEYVWIYWTDFRNLFTIWQRFTCRWWICTLFSNLSRDVTMATK